MIKQALHCGDDGVKIWGTEIQIVSIVARIRNIRVQSTKITYTIQDITGRMRAVLWLDMEAMDEDVRQVAFSLVLISIVQLCISNLAVKQIRKCD